MLVQRALDAYREGRLLKKVKHFSHYKLLLFKRDIASDLAMLKHGRFVRTNIVFRDPSFTNRLVLADGMEDTLNFEMTLDLKDKGISRDIYFEGVREFTAVESVTKYVKKGDIVYDIGANIGYYTNILSRLVGKDGVVVAFEPVKENFKMLLKNSSHLKNVIPDDTGVSDTIDYKTMYMAKQSNWHSLSRGHFTDNTCVIRTDTLDNIVEYRPSPNFIKMDVEGHEYEIMKGAKKLLKSKKPLIMFMEVHPTYMGREKTKNLLEVLDASHFTLLKSTKDFNEILRKIGDDKIQHDYSSIEEMLKSEDFLNGRQGCFECFFGRRI